MIAGKTFVVGGYGDVGKGCAASMKGYEFRLSLRFDEQKRNNA